MEHDFAGTFSHLFLGFRGLRAFEPCFFTPRARTGEPAGGATFFYHRDGDGAVLGKSKSNDFGVLSLLLSLSLSLSLMLMLMLMHQQKLH